MVLTTAQPRNWRNKMKPMIIVFMVSLLAFTTQLGAQEDYCVPSKGPTPRPASDWNPCRERGLIASMVADMRDHKVPQADAADAIMESFPSLRGKAVDAIAAEFV